VPQRGQLFAGRYLILAVLGQGGTGRVYHALDRERSQEVALKVLAPETPDDGVSAGRPLREDLDLALRIRHPNVVRTLGLGEEGGLRFLAMEYVPGTTLREVIDRGGAVPLDVGLRIARQLCQGVSAVHDAGILHRDIKPTNIMVLPSGILKLMDFGIARAATGVNLDGETDATVGTPYYMSPEQVRGLPLDARSDLYAVGVVLYEMFTGVRPIEGRDPPEVMRGHAELEPTPASRLRPDLPALLTCALMDCLSKNRDRRPASAHELYGALTRPWV
jgi:serine/threonine-protein kinase